MGTANVETARVLPLVEGAPSFACPYCGTNPQPLHDEVGVPVCCMRAQHKAIYGTEYVEKPQ